MKFAIVFLATASPGRTEVVAKKVEAAFDPAARQMMPGVGNDKNAAVGRDFLLQCKATLLAQSGRTD